MFEAHLNLLQADSLFLILVGTFLGIVVGAMPGLTGAMLIALTLPLTYSFEPSDAMMLLVSMYVGSISGGLITATLLRMPGTPASIMTTLDGFPMAQGGNPERALGLGITASFAGGIISWGFLLLLSGPIARLSASFGPFELFSLVLMALVLMASVGGKSILRSLFSGFLGILVSMPGISTATGQARMTLGYTEMNDGFQLLPVLIGLFAVNQALRDILVPDKLVERVEVRQGLNVNLADFGKHAFASLRASIVGTGIGILPGIGANIGSVTAYALQRKLSKAPEEFGKGAEDGIVASESANNATVGGALIPLVAMGLPGSVIDAILLGALIVHGLQPGPRLFQDDPQIVYTIMGSYLIANLAMLILMLIAVRWLARISMIERSYLVPVILTCCVVGAYALSNRMFDVWVMLGFGIAGYSMERMKIPLAPFVIGFVLGPIAEENLSAGLMSSAGSYFPLVSRPISLVFLVVAAGMLISQLRNSNESTATRTDTSELGS